MKLGRINLNVHFLFGFFLFNQVILAQSDETADELLPVMILSEAPQSEASSVTLLGGDMVTLGGIQEVRDIQTVLPNFTVFDSNNTRTPKFSVRGLRENNYGAGQAAIGMYVDGIPYKWTHGRIVLIGDAAHPMMPDLAQGASQTFLDALVLRDVFTKTKDIDQALREYEHQRRDAAYYVVRCSKKGSYLGRNSVDPIAVRYEREIEQAN